MITLMLLACAPIVVVERTEIELDPVTIAAAETWSVDFEVSASEEAMSRYYSGEVSALARDVELDSSAAFSGSLLVGDETMLGELDTEWESTLELWVKPWGACTEGSCTHSGRLELSTTVEASFTPVLVGTLLLETSRSGLPDDATVEIALVE